MWVHWTGHWDGHHRSLQWSVTRFVQDSYDSPCVVCVMILCDAVCHRMFKHIFNGLEKQYPRELQVIRQQYPSESVQFTDEPCIIHWDEAMEMLKSHNIEVFIALWSIHALVIVVGQDITDLHATVDHCILRNPIQILFVLDVRLMSTMTSVRLQRYSWGRLWRRSIILISSF